MWGKKKSQKIARAESEVRSCIAWLRGERNAGRGQQPFNMRLMAFDLEVALADLTDTERPDPIDPCKVEPDDLLMLNKGEVEALLFHYHKKGIPKTQVAAKRLEARLCKFVEKKPWEPIEFSSVEKGVHISIAGRPLEIEKIDDEYGAFLRDPQGGQVHLDALQLGAFGYRVNKR